MNIKSFASRVAAALFAVTLFSVPVAAQSAAQAAALTYTTLSANVDGSQTQITVASATGISAPGTGSTLTYLFVDRELMQVRAVSGTTISVARGQQGTGGTHASGAVVAIGGPQAFTTVDPTGTCTTAQAGLQVVNVRSGLISSCAASTAGFAWIGWSPVPVAETRPRTVVATQAYTILPTDYLVVLSTTSAGVSTRSFTLPSHTGLAGKQIVVKDESGGISSTTGIVLIGTIDGTNSSVATVIQLKTAFGAWIGYAGSGGWFTLSCGNGGGAVLSACR